MASSLVESSDGVARGPSGVSVSFEPDTERERDLLIIFDDEDFFHNSFLALRVVGNEILMLEKVEYTQ